MSADIVTALTDAIGEFVSAASLSTTRRADSALATAIARFVEAELRELNVIDAKFAETEAAGPSATSEQQAPGAPERIALVWRPREHGIGGQWEEAAIETHLTTSYIRADISDGQKATWFKKLVAHRDELERDLAEERREHQDTKDSLATAIEELNKRGKWLMEIADAVVPLGSEKTVDAAKRVVAERESWRLLAERTLARVEEERREHAATREELAKLRDGQEYLKATHARLIEILGAQREHLPDAATRVIRERNAAEHAAESFKDERNRWRSRYEALRDLVAGAVKEET